jgi:hypothetical protein
VNTALPPLPFETPVAAGDLEVMAAQVGRTMRGVHSIARRCACGRPAVVRTLPRLPGGTPFPTSFYLTLPSMVAAASHLEAVGTMTELTTALEQDTELAEAYGAAHRRYLDRRAELGQVAEVDGISAGGMPTRVKCLHALVGHALAEGPGVNPIGDRVLERIREDADITVCRCAPDLPRSADAARSQGTAERSGGQANGPTVGERA